jgi:DNA-binding transcriptional MerR regulator
MTQFTIGTLARRSGVKVPTIRYYEQAGLIAAPPRTAGGQRRYGVDALERLRFIRHGRGLGFTLDAIRELLALSARPEQSCAEADHIARRQLADVEARITQLLALRAELRRMVDTCGCGTVRDCKVLEVMSEPGGALPDTGSDGRA